MRFSELDGKTVGLWGLGRETRSFISHARIWLPNTQIAVLVSEDPHADYSELEPLGTRVVDAGDAVAELGRCDVVVRSPGVSIHRPEIQALRQAGVPVKTATGLWLSEREGRRTIGITGTKGKSTTATMLAHLLAAADEHVELAGNIGRPALELLEIPVLTWAVVELSSYQIADLDQGPEIVVLTNLYDEHVDWHGSAETYRQEKLRLLSLPGVRQCVLPAGDESIEQAAAGKAVRRFGAAEGWHVTGEGVADGLELRIAKSELPLRGDHNALNLCAALTALQAAGIDIPPLPEALEGIRALPHRLQTVLDRNGIEFVDDSISTTPESALAALAAFADRPVVLIAGGQDRSQRYESLARAVADRRLTVIGLPATGSRLLDAAGAAGVPADRVVGVADMREAVMTAVRLAPAGAVVLLSPAAPSYDSYRNFEERGAHFAALAHECTTA